MARRPRIHYPGAVYHVILRGNGGQPIFAEDGDFLFLYSLLREGIDRFGFRIHAFCFMLNHIHLVVQVGDIPLPRIMQNLSFRYARRMNWRYKRTGHLFQGRYKALLIDVDNYLLELIRYIHLNPVRARVVATAEEYPWSSHRCYLGRESIPWLTTELVLSMLCVEEGLARRRYDEFVRKDIPDAHTARIEFRQGKVEGRILGDHCFAEEALRRSGEPIVPKASIDDVVAAVAADLGLTAEDLAAMGKDRKRAEGRAIAAFIVRETPGLKLSELGQKVNRDLSILSREARMIASRMDNDKELANKVGLLMGRMRKSK
jgi:putative transposase